MSAAAIEVRVGLPYLPGRPDHAFLTAITQLGLIFLAAGLTAATE